MAPKPIAPAEPPEPSPRKRLFQELIGIQTSKLMWDCGVGVANATTRQKPGRLLKTSPSGAVKLPGCTVWALVIVTWGRLRAARLSHVPAAEAASQLSKVARKLEHTKRVRTLSFIEVSSHGCYAAPFDCC